MRASAQVELGPLEKLHEACRTSDYAAVAAFPAAELDVKTQSGGSVRKAALHWAVEGLAKRPAERLQIVRLLVERGANLQQRSSDGRTPFHHACRDGWDRNLLEFLILKGADVNDPGGFRNGLGKGCALHIAAERLDLPLVQFLLEKGARPDIVAGQPAETPLCRLLRTARVGPDERKRGLVLAITKVLLDAGAPPGVACADGRTALHYAAWTGHLECLKELVSRGGDVSAVCKERRTVLHYAAMNLAVNDRGVFGFLVGTNRKLLQATDALGNTPLHTAVSYASSVAVQELLLQGADAGLRNTKGERPVEVESFWRLEQATQQMLIRYTPREPLPEPQAPPKPPKPFRVRLETPRRTIVFS